MTVVGAALAGGLATAAGAQGTGLIFPGQPFQNAQPNVPGAKGESDGESSPILGGRYGLQANLLRTYDDNMYYAPSSASKVKAWGWALQPSLKYSNDMPRLQLTGAADGTLASYNTPGQHDDYADGKLSAGAHWTPLLLDQFNLNGSYTFSHDPLGTARTEGVGGVPASASAIDKWNLVSAQADWLHGATISGLAFETKVGYSNKTYVNNKVSTQYENYSVLSGEGLAYYAVTPKTQVLLDFIAAQNDSPNTAPGTLDRSGMQYDARVGARWFATAKTFGELRVGALRREFDHGSQPNFTGASWIASINWAARPYRLFTFETGQRSDPSYLPGAGFINTYYAQAQWMEDWTPRLYTRLVGNYVRSQFVNTSPERKDDNYFGGLFVNYSVTRNLTLFGIGAFGRRNSDDGALDYSRTDAFLGIRYVFFNNID